MIYVKNAVPKTVALTPRTDEIAFIKNIIYFIFASVSIKFIFRRNQQPVASLSHADGVRTLANAPINTHYPSCHLTHAEPNHLSAKEPQRNTNCTNIKLCRQVSISNLVHCQHEDQFCAINKQAILMQLSIKFLIVLFRFFVITDK